MTDHPLSRRAGRYTVLALLLATAGLAADPPSVILISIDTLRADHLSAYGYRRIHTPNIDSFAERGTLFTNVEAQVPLTLPSHTVLFTSTYPVQNQIEENAERVPAGMVALASVLRQHGYQTAAFIGSVYLESEMGLDQGFDFYDSPFHFEAFSPISGSMFFGGARPNQFGVRDRAMARWCWARHGAGWPIAQRRHSLLCTCSICTSPTSVLATMGNWPTPTGSSALFKQALVDTGWWRRSIVLLLSDHGESLGEHGEDSHGYFVYKSTLRVPLMVHWPADRPAHAAREDRPAGLIDVAPTILDAVYIPTPSSFEGHSPLGADYPRSVYSESIYAHEGFGWAPLHTLRVGMEKYIDSRVRSSTICNPIRAR